MRAHVVALVLIVQIKVLDAEQKQLSPEISVIENIPGRAASESQRSQQRGPPLPVPPHEDGVAASLLEIGPLQPLNQPGYRRQSTGSLGAGKFLPGDYQKRYAPDDLTMGDCFSGPGYIKQDIRKLADSSPLKVTDTAIIMESTPDKAELLQGSVGGGWIPEMAVLLGKEGEVTHIDSTGVPTIFGFKWSPNLVSKKTRAITTRDQCNVCDQIYRNSLIWNWQWHYSALCNQVPHSLMDTCKIFACKMATNCPEFISSSCHIRNKVVTPCPAKYVCWKCLGVPQEQMLGCFDGK